MKKHLMSLTDNEITCIADALELTIWLREKAVGRYQECGVSYHGIERLYQKFDRKNTNLMMKAKANYMEAA